MSYRLIKPGIFAVGAIDWDRTLFDELIPLPDGTSYNSYLIKGNEKIALIDTVDPTKTTELLDNLKNLNVQPDYIISNHAEQDHSGSIPAVLKMYPEISIITNPRCKELLMEFHLIPEDKFILVEDGDTILLGDKTLKFIYTPWSHWPETMVTYLIEDRILFSCDLFGSHLATSELFGEGFEKVNSALKRYYAEIMMPFRTILKGNIKKIKELEIDFIAPSHGPVHNDPELVLDAYINWVSDETKNQVVIPYVSMHGSTELMVKYLVDALIEKEVNVKPFNLSTTDVGELAVALVDASTIVIASPTVLIGPHPLMVFAVYLTNVLKPKLKFAGVIGSYGWGGRMYEQIEGMLTNLKVDFMEPVIIKGLPKEDDFKKLDKMAQNIFENHTGRE
jgi:flavorubredoxin